MSWVMFVWTSMRVTGEEIVENFKRLFLLESPEDAMKVAYVMEGGQWYDAVALDWTFYHKWYYLCWKEPRHVIYEKKEKIKIDYSGLNMSLQVNSLVKQVDQVVMFNVM